MHPGSSPKIPAQSVGCETNFTLLSLLSLLSSLLISLIPSLLLSLLYCYYYYHYYHHYNEKKTYISQPTLWTGIFGLDPGCNLPPKDSALG